jgi:hypothetical protein
LCIEEDRYPRTNPINIIIKVRDLIDKGIKVIWFLTGLIHIRVAPEMIANDDSLIIGVVIAAFSEVYIHGVEFMEESKVTIENRIE